MKCLVTGVAGFVGSSLSAQLLKNGHEVIGIDSFTDYYDVDIKRRNVAGMCKNDRFSLHEADLNAVDVGALVTDVELIFHQAGQPGVRKSWGKDFTAYVDANVQATQRLLEAVKGSTTLRRLVYASSSSVYGEAQRYPTTEDDVPRPISPYGVTKLAAEHLCSLYAHNFGTPTTSLRYFTVYGPRQRTDMAFTKFIRAALTGEAITVYGDGTQLRDFTYIDDVVAANIMSADADIPPGRVFNVAGGGTTSVREVLDVLEELAGSLKVEYSERIAGDVFQTGGATDRIRTEVGWEAETTLRDGLAQQFEWGKSEFSADPDAKLENVTTRG